MTREVSNFYTIRNHNKLLEKNICPVTTDFIKTDGITLPPIGNGKRAAGAPKKKRLRPNRNYIDEPTGTYRCKICKEIGHNARTCPRAKGGEPTDDSKSDVEETGETGIDETLENNEWV
jgi:hypothetical protein